MTPRSIIFLMALLAISGTLTAGEKKDQRIANLTIAYGGQTLVNLQSYTITNHYLAPTTGQSHTPSLMEVSSSKQPPSVDKENKLATYETWSEGRSGTFQVLRSKL